VRRADCRTNGVEVAAEESPRTHRPPRYTINVDAGGGEESRNGKHTFVRRPRAGPRRCFHSVTLTVRNSGGPTARCRARTTRSTPWPRPAAAFRRNMNSRRMPKRRRQGPTSRQKAAGAARPAIAADMKKVADGTGDAAAIARLSTTPLYNALMRTTCVATMLSGRPREERVCRQTGEGDGSTVGCYRATNPATVERDTSCGSSATRPCILAPADTGGGPSPASPLRPDLFAAGRGASVKGNLGPVPVRAIMEDRRKRNGCT